MSSTLLSECIVNQRGNLSVDDGHVLYWEQHGLSDGMPLVALHGWPGSASSPRCREQFDLAMWCTTLFDQRGCGNCYAEDGLHANTTAHLVADIEVLRRHRHVENWCVAGDCWGATLAQALPGSRLSWISGAGHDPYHPAILQAWQSALAAMGQGRAASDPRQLNETRA